MSHDVGMRRTTAALVVVAAAVTIIAGDLAGSDRVGAQIGPRLDLESQTLVVDEAPVEIVVGVPGAPAGAQLEVTIHRSPLQTVDALRESFETPPTGSRLSFFTCPLEGACGQADVVFGADDTITITLPEAEIGEALRFNTGALTLVVRLLDDEGDELDAFTTSLLVLDPDAAPVDVGIGFVAGTGAPLSHRADATLELDQDALFESAAALAARDNLPVTVEVRPETLDTMSELGTGALDRLLAVLDDRPVMRTSWVEMDEEAWRAAGAADQVIAQYARGNATIETTTGDSPTGLVRLDPDAGPETLGLLRTIGASAVVVADSQVVTGSTGLDRFQPFRLLDQNGLAIPALRVDDVVAATLADPDPELGGYRALAELVMAAHTASTDLAVVLDLDRLDPAALDVVLDGIATRSELHTADVGDLVDLEPARTATGAAVHGDLIEQDHADVSTLAAELRAAATAIDTLAAMLDPETAPIVELRTRLSAAVSSDLTADEARRYADAVFDEVLAGTAGISVAPSDRITLTDRRTEIPLVIVNEQPLPINVEILLSAEKLRFPDGDRLPRTLRPGTNTLQIPVETLASGDARVTATLVSPGGLFELGSGTVDIRSTAISGLGLIISIVALAILGAWWIRTILRVRRNRAAATVSAASVDTEPTSTEGEP